MIASTEIKAAERAGDRVKARRLLAAAMDAEEAADRVHECGVAPWYYWRAHVLGDATALARFARQRHAPGVMPDKLLGMLRRIA